jgi:hypothetical protein
LKQYTSKLVKNQEEIMKKLPVALLILFTGLIYLALTSLPVPAGGQQNNYLPYITRPENTPTNTPTPTPLPTPTCDTGVTGANGIASCTRSIGGATAGFQVNVDVQISGHQVTTWFVPQP